MSTKIPGRLQVEDLARLLDLVEGKAVLMLGCYCGRGLVTVARHARRVWVLEDFQSYPDGVEGVVAELKANVDRNVPEEKRIDLLYGTAAGWAVPFGSEQLRKEEVQVVYRDANRPSSHEESDQAFAAGLLREQGGIFAWHSEDGALRWLEVQPVPVEVN